MSEYRNKFDELHQFFAGYFHQDWSRVYDWKDQQPNFSAVVRHFKATNPQSTILKLSNQLEDLLEYDLDEQELKSVLSELGSNLNLNAKRTKYRNFLEQILKVLNDPSEQGIVLKEIL